MWKTSLVRYHKSAAYSEGGVECWVSAKDVKCGTVADA